MALFSTDTDALRDTHEYLIGQFEVGSATKVGEFYTPQRISNILSKTVTLDSQEPSTGPRAKLESVMDFACGSGSLLLNIRKRITDNGGRIGKIFGQEKNITTYNLSRMNMLLHGVKDSEFETYHLDTLTNDWDMLWEMNPAKMPKIPPNPKSAIRNPRFPQSAIRNPKSAILLAGLIPLPRPVALAGASAARAEDNVVNRPARYWRRRTC